MSTVVVWGMTVGGGGGTPTLSSSLGAWGIEKPQLHFRNMDDDEFTFEIKQNALLATYLIYGETVNLVKFVNGVANPWFQGTVSKITIEGNVKSEVVKYVVSGPWHQLKRTLWQAASQCYNPTTCALQSLKMTKVVLFQDPITGLAITTGQQISNLINYAESIGTPIGIGITPAFINVPFEETRDLLISDAIRRCMQWTPDGVGWFNYSSGVPTFNAQQRALLSSVTLDLALENLISSFALTPRSDLVPTGVRFNYVGSAYCNVEVPTGCADPSTGIINTGAQKLSQAPVQVQTITQDAIALPDIPGGIIGTIDLQQLTATTSENPPIGLAAQYYDSLVTVFWEGTVTTHEQECSGSLRPGLVLNLLNGQGAWATMATPIQQVTEDLYDGITTATLGTPQHLSPQTFAWLVNQTARRGLVVSGLSAVNTPGSSGTNCSQGVSPETQKLLNKVQGSAKAVGNAAGIPSAGFAVTPVGVCEGGMASSLNVYTQPGSH
jgi:hypothetical protein